MLPCGTPEITGKTSDVVPSTFTLRSSGLVLRSPGLVPRNTACDLSNNLALNRISNKIFQSFNSIVQHEKHYQRLS